MDEASPHRAEPRRWPSPRWSLALLLGLLVGGALDLGKRLFGGPDPRNDRLVGAAVDARAEPAGAVRRALCLRRSAAAGAVRRLSAGADADPARRRPLRARPGQARAPTDVAGTRTASTLSVTLPDIEIAGPEVDLAAAPRIWRGRGAVRRVTDADQALDRGQPRPRRRRSAQAGAGGGADAAGARGRRGRRSSAASRCRSQAAGFDDAKVVARFRPRARR